MHARRGFSIVEMLVAVALFSALMLMCIAALIVLIDANYKARSVKTAMDNLGFIIEDMARDLRLGSRYYCVVDSSTPPAPSAMILPADSKGAVCVYEKNDLNSGGVYLAFSNKDNQVAFYYFDSASKTLKKKVTTTPWNQGHTDSFTSGYLTLSSSDMTIDRFRFYVYNTGNALAQPYVVITAKVTVGSPSRPKSQTTFSIQTMVSQRIPGNAY